MAHDLVVGDPCFNVLRDVTSVLCFNVKTC